MKIHLIQLSSDPNHAKEIASFNDLNQLDVDYIRHVNPNYTELPPKGVVNGEDHIIKMTKKHNEWGLTPPHYGCFKSHCQAIASAMCKDHPTLICENDTKIINPTIMNQKIQDGAKYMLKNKYKILRFETPSHGDERKSVSCL